MNVNLTFQLLRSGFYFCCEVHVTLLFIFQELKVDLKQTYFQFFEGQNNFRNNQYFNEKKH